MRLSIVIPAYNAGKYLDCCLESCFRQDISVTEYEIIIVNDGSTDDTEAIARRWESVKSNIRVISQENRGLSEARNAGFSSAEGEYIMFLDSDDWIADNCLKLIIGICSRDRLDMLRFCAARMIDGKPYRMYSYRKFIDVTAGRDLLHTGFFVCVPFAVYRKGFLNENGLRFHPGIYHEDNEFTPRAYYHAERVGSIDDIVYHLRQTPGSITHSINPKKVRDLQKVACSLKDFADTKVEHPYRSAVLKQAADCLNSCFRELNRMDEKEAETMFLDIYNCRKEIIGYFTGSSSVRHNIEGIMLSIFPKRMLCVHKLLDLVHYKERRRQKGLA